MTKTYEFDWSKAWPGTVAEKFEDFYRFLCDVNKEFPIARIATSNKFVLARFMNCGAFQPHIPEQGSGYFGKIKQINVEPPNITNVFSGQPFYEGLADWHDVELILDPNMPVDEVYLTHAKQWLEYAIVKMKETPE